MDTRYSRAHAVPAKNNYIKQLVDFFISFALLAPLSPLMLFIAVLIKIESRGPVFFLQKRCGQGGKEFRMLKFRTMVQNAEALRHHLKNEVDGPMFKMLRDPRVTRVGRFLRCLSLDELPQLINVLRGEMSLVGPRPLAWQEMSMNSAWMEARLTVKPGITGLWQVKARETLKFSDWVKYDMEYVEHGSVLLDLKILLLTIPSVIRRRGAT